MYWGAADGDRPQDSVDLNVPAWRRQALVFILKNGVDAHPDIRAKGWASCRICGAMLGSMDLTRFGFVWPEKAEHYVLAHDVWTPECSLLLESALSHAAPRVGSEVTTPTGTRDEQKRAAKLFEFSSPAGRKRPWWFESTGPAFFNEWSLAHVGWGVVWQLLFPGRRLAGLVAHTIYESIEGQIFPRTDRDVSMENHVGDTIAFAAGMLVVPPMSSPTDMMRRISEARSRSTKLP